MIRRTTALALLLLLAMSGCSRQPPPVVVSYSQTPAPALIAPPTASPTPKRARQPTRRSTTSRSTSSASTSPTSEAAQPDASPSPLSSVDSDLTSPSPESSPSDATFGDATPGPSPARRTPTTLATIPGQVPEAQGNFVTSSSPRSRYYYARADTDWHRIRLDDRVWFLTADALLRAFPGRLLHGAPTPTPGGQLTPTPAPQ